MDGPGDCQYYERCLDEQQRTLWSATEGDSRGYADDATWILTSSFVIFTMQSGFGMLEAGSCSPGFEVNIMMKNIVDVVFTALSFYLVGYGIAFGEPSTPFTGVGHMPADGGYGEVESGLLYSQYIFQLSFAATSTTIVSGCVAMRLKFTVYMLYSLFSVIFYSFVAHWIFTSDGWLNQVRVLPHDCEVPTLVTHPFRWGRTTSPGELRSTSSGELMASSPPCSSGRDWGDSTALVRSQTSSHRVRLRNA
mmetsp:Transcript_15981/g.36845  ORF Transcript_15981/g.36845 Transcript_15981/m.36845 type:complete len:250 (+) Transcript_15981:182-931(+)